MDQEREKNVSQDLWYTEEGWLDYLKSRRYLRLPNSPFSMIEFEEYVEEYFLPLMDHSEKAGYEAFLMVVRKGKSMREAAKAIGADDGKCREFIGRFCNFFCTTSTPDLFAYLPDDVASAMKCQIRGEDDAARHLKSLSQCKQRRSTAFCDCPTYIPRTFGGVDQDLAEEILLQMVKTPAFSAIVRWSMRRGLEREEAEQELLIAMCGALGTFDASKSSLSGFLTMVGKRQISSRIKHEASLRRRRVENVYFRDWMANEPSRKVSPSETALETRLSLLKSLTPLEKRAVRARVRGLSYVKAGLDLEGCPLEEWGKLTIETRFGGSSRGSKAIDNALCRVVNKARRRGSNDSFS